MTTAGHILDAAERLTELGFTQYESTAYVGLLENAEPTTGYRLAQVTGLPQPKVYETLRRLADRGAVVQVGTDPARFVALTPRQLLNVLETDFRRRISDAKVELSHLAEASGGESAIPFSHAEGWGAVKRRVLAMLGNAHEHVYVSAHSDQVSEISDALQEANSRGVRFDVLHFGPLPLELEGRAVRHSSTDGVVYRQHQARHLAVVVDSVTALWALAPMGDDWTGFWRDDRLFAALVKGYIRHDMYVQQIFQDFAAELEQAYGAGLQALVSSSRSAPDDAPDLRGAPSASESA